MSDKYINFNNSRRHKRHFKKSVIFAAVVLCIAAAGFFAVNAYANKPAASPDRNTKSSLVKNAGGNSKNARKSQSNPANASSDNTQDQDPDETTNHIPVLMFHSIDHDPKFPNNILRIPRGKFAKEMEWLHDNGYKTLSLDELYSAIKNKKQVYKKSVVITFDDGYGDNYFNAYPYLKKYHFKATVFMITSKINDVHDGYLTAAQIKEMDKNGVNIECHTVNHLSLDTLSYKRQYKELSDSKAKLAALLGHPIDYIAYPSGKYNSDTIAAAKKIGYKICFKMNGGTAALDDSLYEFPRTFVGEDLNDFINRVEGTSKYSPA